jgi:hypothetical protein
VLAVVEVEVHFLVLQAEAVVLEVVVLEVLTVEEVEFQEQPIQAVAVEVL